MTWQEINNKRLPFIRLGERIFKAMYTDIRKTLIASFANLTTPEEIIEASRKVTIDPQIVYLAMQRFYLRTGMSFARSMSKHLHRGMETKQDDLWEQKILEYVRANTGWKITEIMKTHYKDIERITRLAVEQGISEGWGMDKIARVIQKSQGEIDLWKALRIARTEVVAASNEGVKVGAEDLPGSKEKVWISTFDGRARGANSSDTHDHLSMDGVRVPMGDNFITPNGNSLEFPGDPNCKDPGEIINCRCGYEIVVIPEIY